MQIQSGKPYAVITGDIVGFSRLAESERIHIQQILRHGSRNLMGEFGACVPLEVDIYRGDGWQLLLTEPRQSLRVALSFRTYLRYQTRFKRVDTRMAIAVGTIDFLPGSQVSAGDGQVFRLSGHALETMDRNRRMTFAFPQEDARPGLEALDTLVHLIDALATDWTDRQAQAVAGALKGWTQEQIAQAWLDNPISQQAVGQHLDRARWSAVNRGILFFEACFGTERGGQS